MHCPSSASELQLCATATFSSFFTFSLTCSAGHIVCWRLLFVFQISALQAYRWRYQFPPKTFSPSFICRNSLFIHTKSLHWIASDWMDQVFFLHRFFICNPHVFYELIMSMPPIFFLCWLHSQRNLLVWIVICLIAAGKNSPLFLLCCRPIDRLMDHQVKVFKLFFIRSC